MISPTLYLINEQTGHLEEVELTGPQQVVVEAYQRDALDVLREFYRQSLPAFVAAGIAAEAVPGTIARIITDLIADHVLSDDSGSWCRIVVHMRRCGSHGRPSTRDGREGRATMLQAFNTLTGERVMPGDTVIDFRGD